MKFEIFLKCKNNIMHKQHFILLFSFSIEIMKEEISTLKVYTSYFLCYRSCLFVYLKLHYILEISIDNLGFIDQKLMKRVKISRKDEY